MATINSLLPDLPLHEFTELAGASYRSDSLVTGLWNGILNATLSTSDGTFSVIPRQYAGHPTVRPDMLYVAVNRYDPYSTSTAIIFDGRSDAFNNWDDLEERLTAEARKEAARGNPRPQFVYMIAVSGRLSRFYRFQRSAGGGEVTNMAYANGRVSYESIPVTPTDMTTRTHQIAIRAFLRAIRDSVMP